MKNALQQAKNTEDIIIIVIIIIIIVIHKIERAFTVKANKAGNICSKLFWGLGYEYSAESARV